MFENKTFSFVKHFKLFLIISAILVVTGVVGLVTLPFGSSHVLGVGGKDGRLVLRIA